MYKKTSGAVAPDTTPKLEVEKTEIELTSDGGEGTVEVTVANVYSLQVRALAEAGSQDEVTWLSVEYDENGTLSYTAEANGSENSREADIEIYAEDLEGNSLTKYIHVTQAGKSEGGAAVPVDVTISFATTAQRTSQTTTQQVWANEGVTLTNNKSESQNDIVDSSNPVKFYAASQIIITAPGNISQIVFDCDNDTYATALKNSISGASVAVSSNKVTITLNGSSDTFTIAKLSAQVRADAVTVTYLGEATGGETPEPEQPTLTPRNLAFSSTTATATVGQAFTEPTLSGETAGVTYSSSNTGVATVNASTGAVTLVSAGTTTITATAPETEQYEAGEVSYTLTVNPAQKTGYTLITDLSEITTGQYVIAAKVSGKYYAMSKTFASKITGTEVSVSNDAITESAAANYVVTITKSGSNYTIKSGSNYLKYSSSTNLGTQTSAYNWTIAKGTKGTFRFTSGTSGRGLVFRASSYKQFGGYALSNVTANGTEYYDVELFKLN